MKKSVVAAVCDRRVLFISMAWSALIERRYNFFTPSGVGVTAWVNEWRALIILYLVAVFLSGCALSKPPQHAKVVEQSLPQGTTIPETWSSVTGTNDVTNDWLKSFNDPSLDAVVVEAIKNNLNLHQAADRVEIARQNVTVVGSQLLPQIGAQIGAAGTLADKYAAASQSNNDKFYGTTHEYGGVSWEIDLWGRLRAQREASEAVFRATRTRLCFCAPVPCRHGSQELVSGDRNKKTP